MKKDKDKFNPMAELRKRAEERLQRLGETPLEELSAEEARRLLHELQTHQIELEMQNEELRTAQIRLEDSRSRYSDLYDFAPLGYFTLDPNGMIVEANLTGSALLGEARKYVINKRFSQFIPREYQDAFYLHRRKAVDTKTLERCEIKLRRKDGPEFFAQLESIALENREGNVTQLRISVSDVTERKASEKALREQQHLIERITDATPYIVYIYDLVAQRNIFVNAQVSTVLGYTPETVQEMGSALIERLVHPDDRHLLEQHHQEMMSNPTDKPREVEYRTRRADQKWRTLRSRDVVFKRDPEGTPREILGTAVDITEHKQTGQALQLSHLFLEIANRHVELPSLLRDFTAKIQQFTRCPAVGIGLLDEKGDFSCRSFVGFTRDFCEKESLQLMRQYGQTFAHGVKEEGDPYPAICTVGGSFFTRSTTELLGTDTLREWHPMGDICHRAGYESVALVPIRDGWRLSGLIQVADPLKERISPEKVQILERVAMQLGTAIHRVVIEQELDKHREQLEEIVEQRTGELRRSIEDLAHETGERERAEDRVKRMALFAALNPSPVLRFDGNGSVIMGNPAAVEILGEGAKNGAPVTTLIPGAESFDWAACIRDGAILSHVTQIGNRFFHFVFKGVPNLGFVQGYGTDITERRLAEAEAVRASHLASLGELAAGVAHEINNPTNGIINYAQLLINRCQDDDSVHDLAGRIVQEGHRIARIVKSLLSFSRDRPEEKSPLHLHEVLANTLALTETVLRRNNIHIKVGFPADLPPILANSHEIQQVFMNIISNAQYALNRKYPKSNDGKILEIDAERVQIQGRPGLRIVFHDRGIGIPADIMDKVLNPFFTTKPEDQGTGLGLSISQAIVSKHQGKLMFDSKEGEFTKVMVDVPLAPESVDPA